ncbi:MAG: hypothetical protein IPQ09_23470 [Myxococcales bacterium]|nr:hypothetical protein [Myxococcales bacterium]
MRFHRSILRFAATLALVGATLAGRESRAACPVGLTVSVDNDVPGSGYSEVKPENWESHNVDSCRGTYRYLSQYIGDRTRKGKATWQPKITVAGFYEVTASYRGSVNRTNDADYTLYDDKATVSRVTLDQTATSGCTRKVVGMAFCAVGGTCRLTLDGDDGKSDAADETTFVLKACEVPDAGAPADAGAPDASALDASRPAPGDAGSGDAGVPPSPGGPAASPEPGVPPAEPAGLAPLDEDAGCSSGRAGVGARSTTTGLALLLGGALLVGARRRRR